MDKPHKKLEAWKRGMELAEAGYHATAAFPREEQFGLTSQMRRAAVSMVSNIAEGSARHGRAENAQFVSIAIGSASELDTQLELAKQLGFPSEAAWQRLDSTLSEVDRMLIGLAKYLRSSPSDA